MNKDIRWRQRFTNLQKALVHLEAACNKKVLNDLEVSGLLQIFNFTFELSWKTLKDYLESQGIAKLIKGSFYPEIKKLIETLDEKP